MMLTWPAAAAADIAAALSPSCMATFACLPKVLEWTHGPLENFAEVASTLLHMQIILVPTECTVSLGTIDGWRQDIRQGDHRSAVGVLARRPVRLIATSRAMTDLFLLIPVIMIVLGLLR